ncbi:MAG TPA: hypothetical protein DCG69_08250 [Bacteroidales bacterium]|nr:hypothetical protein [Bacteroidales bacterium]
MNIFALVSLFSAICVLGLGLFVYFRSNRNWLTYIFLLLTFGLALLNLSQYHLRTAQNAEQALFWSRIFGIWSIVLGLSVHFTYELIRKKRKGLLFYSIIYLPGILIFYLQLSADLFLLPPIEREWGWTLRYNNEFPYVLVSVYGILYWMLSVYFAIRYFVSTEGVLKKQARLILIGYGINFLITVSTDIIFPYFNINFPELGTAVDLITILLFAYAIWKYQLFILDKDPLTTTLFGSISNYIFLTDFNKRIVEINAQTAEVLGYSPSELIGKRIDKLLFIHKTSHKNDFGYTKDVSTEFKNREIVLRKKNGEAVSLFFNANFLQLTLSSQPGMIYVGTNSETNRMLKQKAAESESRLEFLAEASVDFLKVKSKEEIYSYITQNIYRLMQNKAVIIFAEFEEKLNTNLWQVKSIQGINVHIQELSKLLGFNPNLMISSTQKAPLLSMEEGKLVRLELDFENLTNGLISNQIGDIVKKMLGITDLFTIYVKREKDTFGTISILTLNSSPSIDFELIESFASLCSQVLDRIYAETELEKSHQLFKTIVENSQISIFIFDENGKFVLAKGRHLNKLGIENNDIIGKSVFDEYTGFSFLLQQIRRGLEGHIFSEIVSLKNIIYYHVTFTPVKNQEGKVVQLICMADDITFRVRSEKKLENLAEMQSKIFRVIGHDLKSPIANILSYSNLVISDFELFSRDEIKSFTSHIQNSGNNAFKILENLLEWSKSISKESPIHFETICLKEKVRIALEQVKPLALKKSIQIVIKLNENLHARADRNMVITVLRNILSNAIKFTASHGRIEISDSCDEHNVKIEITDTGIGMNQLSLEKLFEYDANKVSRGTEGEAGSGLGLQISYDFMKKMGGKIEVKSQPEKGSVFTLIFPLPQSDESKKILINPN